MAYNVRLLLFSDHLLFHLLKNDNILKIQQFVCDIFAHPCGMFCIFLNLKNDKYIKDRVEKTNNIKNC